MKIPAPAQTLFIITLITIVGVILLVQVDNKNPITEVLISNNDKEFAFESDRLKTNTARLSIPFEKILDGGPGKDGIPAILNPKFTDVKTAQSWLESGETGIVVQGENAVRFYPYNILVWHEIVNDVVDRQPLVVTFCPLCGSAIVFDANVGGRNEVFGVSGKLYESNLLMYDKTTESLWSQIIGEAVVGDRTGEKLKIFPSQILTFAEVQRKYSQAQVLSKDTGFTRAYGFSPYGDYDTNEDIYFPISIRDRRLPAKEVMYIINYKDKSVAFKLSDLKPGVKATVDVGGEKIVTSEKDGELEARNPEGEIIPGYFAMWFSWAIHHQEDGIVWTAK